MNENKETNEIKPVMECKKCKTKVFPYMTECPICKTVIEKPVTNVPQEVKNEVQTQNPTQTTNPTQATNPTQQSKLSQKVYVKMSEFDSKFGLTEIQMLEEYINEIKEKAGLDLKTTSMPEAACKRKKIYLILFSILLFVYVTMIFFHFPPITYIFGAIILIILFLQTRKYSLMKYIIKEVQSRPSEKILNIVMSIKESLIPNKLRMFTIISSLIAVILPLIIFATPKIIYEEVEGGYAVRYYIFGLTNFKTVEIPEKHKDKNVVSLRGNTFSNMPFLEKVTLPDTIKEIRGQAFYNNKNLVSVKLPNQLEYLGGGNFTNCSKLEGITLPDSLTEIGGESFMNATNLREVKLPKNLKEIRGNTFENCTSLTSVDIPDSVTRIGAHAFRGNSSLSSVYISENSKLTEIGSSAFRECYRLNEITIPKNVYVNERAFKGNGTTIHIYGEETNSNENQVYASEYESEFFSFTTALQINKFYINDYKNEMQVFTGFVDNTKLLLTGEVTNPYYYNGNFDVMVKYYDENQEVIGSCHKKVKLYGDKLDKVGFNCETSEYSMYKKFEDIKYYKIFTENINLSY